MLPSRIAIAGVSVPLGVLVGALGAFWLLGQQACAHSETVRWQTRVVQVKSTEAADKWDADARNCPDPSGGPSTRVTFRKPSTDELKRLVKEYGFTAAELGLAQAERIAVPDPDRPGEIRYIEIPTRPLFKERTYGSMPFGGKGQPYLDHEGNLQEKTKPNGEPILEAPDRWGFWAKVGYATTQAAEDPATGERPEREDPALAWSGMVTRDSVRYHRMHLMPYLEAGKKPGLDDFAEVGLMIGFQEGVFKKVDENSDQSEEAPADE